MKTKLALLITLLVLIPLTPVKAGEFNANNIISDFELEDYSSLSETAIQRFLESKRSFLAQFSQVINGVRKTGSQIIFAESQLYQINPKFILAMLQKEQSLLTDQSPSQDQIDWATGFGVCDSCAKSDPAIQSLKGFYTQVSGLAEKIRVNYLRDLKALGRTFTGWGPGRAKTTLDGFTVTPVNNATAILYTYNPYRGAGGIGANFNFWKIWQRYFVRNYPDGALLQQIGEPSVWLLQKGKRRPFKTRAALYSRHNPDKIIQVSQNELEKYEIGPPIQFANYSLLRAPWGTVYLLVDDTIRGIKSREVFRTIGFNPEEIIDVTEEDLRPYQEDQPLTITSTYPIGALLQDKQTGSVFYVRDGQKQPIIDRSILNINYKNQPIVPVHSDELAQYPDIGRAKLADGTLIKSDPSNAVYIISDGQRRPIVSGEAFEKLGFRWKDVVWVPPSVMNLHTLGQPLDLIVIDGEEEVLGENN